MTAATSQFVKAWRGVAITLSAVVVLVLTQSASAVLVWNANNPPANGYTVQEIIDNGGLRIGDKVFSNFSVTTQGPLAPTASTIRVSGFFTNDGDIGLDFTGAWFANVNQVIDTTIEFAVQADTPFKIEGVDLSLDAVGTLGAGNVSIAELVKDINNQVLADLFVNYQKGGAFNIYQDALTFAPNEKIWVTKDILVTSGGQGIAHLSKFSQTFHQVPEPGTLALAGLGMLAMAHGRRRKRNRA